MFFRKIQNAALATTMSYLYQATNAFPTSPTPSTNDDNGDIENPRDLATADLIIMGFAIAVCVMCSCAAVRCGKTASEEERRPLNDVNEEQPSRALAA